MEFLSNPDECADSMFNAVKNTYSSLYVDVKRKIVIDNNQNNENVKILAGGGSGHEPFPFGFVGDGLLSASVSGNVFAAPPSNHIYSAISTLAKSNNDNGVLVFIMNYTGDIMNFGVAIEQARARGYKVENSIIGEDCSKIYEEVGRSGRRGMTGVVFSIKIAGAMARHGKKISEIKDECEIINKNMYTLGACTKSCTMPGGKELFTVPDGFVEFGIGCHGEAGIASFKMRSLDDVIGKMMERLIWCIRGSRSDVNLNLCIVINNLGAVSNLGMWNVVHSIFKYTGSDNDVKINRVYMGSFMTSLNMTGIQISILNVTEHSYWINYLDEKVDAPSWTSCHVISNTQQQPPLVEQDIPFVNKGKIHLSEEYVTLLRKCLLSAAEEIILQEDMLNKLDSKCGDGDCGSTLKHLALGIRNNINQLSLEYPSICFNELAKLAGDEMGGTSGAIYSLLFTGIADYFISNDILDCAAAWKSSLDLIQKYSIACLGDRTMLDVLIPAYETFSEQIPHLDVKEAFHRTVQVADLECEKTKYMTAVVGRASYVNEEYVEDMDAGAYAVKIWLNAIYNSL